MTEQQFSPLAERYMDTVFRVAYSYLRSPADADDVTQDGCCSYTKRTRRSMTTPM